jgi:ABC-type Fe3+/spermidine/putrescine transport system ATPase subunit
LLDEPLAALDKRLREAMQRELRELQRRVGITFVFVTHDQDEAFALSDRIAVMEKGKILQVAAPGELYRRPNSAAVAAFIGSVNLLRGTCRRATPTRVAVECFGDIDLTVGAPSADRSASGDEDAVTVVVRPEQIQISAAAVAPSPQSVRGTVAGTTYLGERTYVALDIAGLAQAMTACILAQPTGSPLTAGSAVWLDLCGEVTIVADGSPARVADCPR